MWSYLDSNFTLNVSDLEPEKVVLQGPSCSELDRRLVGQTPQNFTYYTW